jgi:plastocyanin
MIDSFDSRALRAADCYGQRFMRPGTYRYDVVNAAWPLATIEYPYEVNVVAVDGKPDPMKQYTIAVRAKGKHFRPDSATITVTEGDLVVWNSQDATKTPFAVVGDKDFFGNASLVNEAGFSHAFSAPGEYEWADALGSNLRGVVRVTEPACANADDFRAWQRLLAKGTVVMISDGQADPAAVDIITGQTVYFAVVKGDGISVTDVRLLTRDVSARA